MRNGEKGVAMVLVLILLAVGSLMIAPSFQLVFTSIMSKQINTDILKDQYARDGAAEFGIWKLQYGSDEDDSVVVLNGIDTNVTIKMRAELGETNVAGAEDNRIKTTLYDIKSEADRTSGQGNVLVGVGGTYLKSWHVDNL